MWKTETVFSPFSPRWTTPAIEWPGRSPFRGASTRRGEIGPRDERHVNDFDLSSSGRSIVQEKITEEVD